MRNISGKTRVEYQLILGDADFVHMEKGLDFLVKRSTQTLQNGRQRPQQTALHSQMAIGTTYYFHAKNLFKP